VSVGDVLRQVWYSVLLEAVNRLWEEDEGRLSDELLRDLLDLIEWCKE